MSNRLLDDWITTYMEYTENSEPPDSYRKWTAIAVLGACLQRKCSLEWEGTMFPNLYVVLVGPSGARKGTAMRPGRMLLEEIAGINLSPEAVTREQLIRRLKKSGEQGLPISGKMHASMTIFSEELTVFLGYGNAQLMADLCDWYDCKNRWKYETKNSGTDDIVNVWVSLMGATTPTLLQSTMPSDAIGGGLTSRIIFVYEPHKGKTIPRPFKTPHEIELEERLIHDLMEIQCAEGEFSPDPTFQDKWDTWYPEQDRHRVFNDPRLDGYLTRRGTHLLKLSMIINVSRDGGMVLTGEDFDRALFELRLVEKKMPQVFRGIGKSSTSDVIDKIMTTIATRGEMTFDEIVGMFYYDADQDSIRRMLSTLTNMSFSGKRLYMWKNNDPTTRTIVYLGSDKEEGA